MKFKTIEKNFDDYVDELNILCDKDLNSINSVILNKLDSNVPLVHEIASYLMLSGGKRLRPLFTSCSYKLCSNKNKKNKNYIKIDEAVDKTTDFLKVGWRMVLMSTLLLLLADSDYWPVLVD